MKIRDVRKMSMHQIYLYWVKEREKIRDSKLVCKEPPWTDDEILNTYKFCNVRRMDDKVSRWLLLRWYGPHFNHENMVVAVTLARHLNNIPTLSEVGFPVNWCPRKIESLLDERQKAGLRNYSGAYMITARYGRDRPPETKQYQTINRVCQPLVDNPPEIVRDSMQETWKILINYMGFSSFIAGQVVADLRWSMEGSWSDRYDWSPVGPGSQRGLNRYLGRDIKTKVTEDELNSFISSKLKFMSRRESYPEDLESIDIQNTLCEYDKYCRVLFNEGKPKQKYHYEEN